GLHRLGARQGAVTPSHHVEARAPTVVLLVGHADRPERGATARRDDHHRADLLAARSRKSADHLAPDKRLLRDRRARDIHRTGTAGDQVRRRHPVRRARSPGPGPRMTDILTPAEPAVEVATSAAPAQKYARRRRPVLVVLCAVWLVILTLAAVLADWLPIQDP